jgi:Cytochrome C biogenesis protein transmembrane region
MPALTHLPIIGIAIVAFALGAMVGILGVHLPAGLDRVFEVVVGVTLVLLGILVLAQVWRQRADYRFTSRWRLLIDLLRRAWLRRRGEVEWDAADPLSRRTAFGIGVLHGTGAETPTQVVLFASAAAAGSATGAAMVLVVFVLGMITSDLLVALFWAGGRLAAIRIPYVQLALGVLTGVASLLIGLAFILQKSALLPAVFGG